MLASLTIRNVVIIEELKIDFAQGLCVLTGETGAGKSILMDALGLALGVRADAGLVRKDADKAVVTAVFEGINDPALKQAMDELDIEHENDQVILRRVLYPEGRSKAFINDTPVSAGGLRDIATGLLEIHGQNDTRGLLDPALHRHFLDLYAGVKQDVAASWKTWQAEKQRYEALKEELEKTARDEEYLRGSLDDLNALDPQAGEEETLAELRDSLMNRERILEAFAGAFQALNHEDDPVASAQGALARVEEKLDKAGQDILSRLDDISENIRSLSADIEAYSADLQHSEHNLESIDERLHDLRLQARKFNCAVDDLPAVKEELAEKLDKIDGSDAHLKAQKEICDTARKTYIEEAKKLSEQRRTSAEKLGSRVNAELAPLKMQGARFVTEITVLNEDDWGPAGTDRVRFMVSTNPGADPGPLHKIASGGEMSRFMLALKVVMAETFMPGTMIFDEIDAGIGGATADAVGERLARLADACQVIVVTHSPQVASRANAHYIVTKTGEKQVKSDVQALDTAEKRREEIARMLAGESITDEARAAAQTLLNRGKAA